MANVEDSYKTAKLPIFSAINNYTDDEDGQTTSGIPDIGAFIPTIENGVVEKYIDSFSGNEVSYLTQRPSFSLDISLGINASAPPTEYTDEDYVIFSLPAGGGGSGSNGGYIYTACTYLEVLN